MEEKNIEMLSNSSDPRYILSRAQSDEIITGNYIGTVEISGYTKDDIQQTSLYMDYKTSSDSDWDRVDLYNPPAGKYYTCNDTYRMTGEFYKGKYINIVANSQCMDTGFYEQKIIFSVDTLDEQHFNIEILHFKPYKCSFDGDSVDTASPYISGTFCSPEVNLSSGGVVGVDNYLDDGEKMTITAGFLTAKALPDDVSIRYGIAKCKILMSDQSFKAISEPFTWSDRIDPEEFVYTNLTDLVNPRYDYLCQKDIELDFSDSVFSDLDILTSDDQSLVIYGYVLSIGSSIYCRDGINDQYFCSGTNLDDVGFIPHGVPSEMNPVGFCYLFKNFPM